jgi:lipopolysaccharide/colanic/teichoic acid biosynthesis glycosyltransferase
VRRYVLLILDVTLLVLATACALLLRENFQVAESRLIETLPYFLATLVAGLLIFPMAGLNRTLWRFINLPDHLRVIAAVTAAAACAAILTFAYNRLEGVARSLPFLQILTAIPFLTGARVLHRLAHERRQRHKASAVLLKSHDAEGVQTILIAGLSRLAETYLQAVAELAPGKVKIAGVLGRAGRHTGWLAAAQPVLGMPEDVESILDTLEVHGVVVDRIVIAAPFQSFSPAARQALLVAEGARNIQLSFLVRDLNLDFDSKDPDDRKQISGGASVPKQDPQKFEISASALQKISGRRYWAIKRAIDFFCAAVLLLLLSPLMLITAFLVAASLGVPILFWQQRPGLGGRPFRLYKFRTMRAAHDSEGRRLSESERVSKIGNALRRLRFDELPQLYNILRGEMSFVGPRPLLPRDQSAAARARLLVRPGLTGWAQVVGGRHITPVEKAALDVWYVYHASLALDAEIALRTVPLVLAGEHVSFALIERAWCDLRARGVLKEHAVLEN